MPALLHIEKACCSQSRSDAMRGVSFQILRAADHCWVTTCRLLAMPVTSLQILRRGDHHEFRCRPLYPSCTMLQRDFPKLRLSSAVIVLPNWVLSSQRIGVCLPRAHGTIPTRRHRNSWPSSPLTVAYRSRSYDARMRQRERELQARTRPKRCCRPNKAP